MLTQNNDFACDRRTSREGSGGGESQDQQHVHRRETDGEALRTSQTPPTLPMMQQLQGLPSSYAPSGSALAGVSPPGVVSGSLSSMLEAATQRSGWDVSIPVVASSFCGCALHAQIHSMILAHGCTSIVGRWREELVSPSLSLMT